MQQHIQTIVKHFFQKESLQDVSEQDLRQFTKDYPYSTIGQFLLAEKWRNTDKEDYQEQALKTALYFHNPTWLFWQLQDHQSAVETITAVPAAPVQQIPVVEQTPVVETVAVETAAENSETFAIPEATIAEPVAPAITSAPAETAMVPEPVAASTDNNTEMAFEPYHTIDYFASQGIKLKLEDLPKDKLGQQLKSFTEWLRSMKRITPSAVAGATFEGMDETAQQSIQLIAEHSVEGKDIVTEAMAEVWVKQGNYRKAIAIYEKLSLLNPVKSPYFADRIQHLKAL